MVGSICSDFFVVNDMSSRGVQWNGKREVGDISCSVIGRPYGISTGPLVAFDAVVCLVTGVNTGLLICGARCVA